LDLFNPDWVCLETHEICGFLGFPSSAETSGRPPAALGALALTVAALYTLRDDWDGASLPLV
jgi:hypothetical protein